MTTAPARRWQRAVRVIEAGGTPPPLTTPARQAHPGPDHLGHVGVLRSESPCLMSGQKARVRKISAVARRDVDFALARCAAVEERARIARELHDVVAHSMSIVHIRAESARYRIDDLDSALAEFTDIARSARSALREMRRLLEALHPDNENLHAPQPTILDIPALVGGTEKAGSPVTFTSDVEPGTVSPAVQLTAYRIVQESLSNVIRHAPHAHVDVVLREVQGMVTVRVQNDAPPSVSPADRAEQGSGGHGLRGMRERVALIHGDIEHILLPGGGFLVTARLPRQQS